MPSKHTPGPWSVAIGKGTCFHQGNRVCVYHVLHQTDDSDTGTLEQTIAEVWPTSGDGDIVDGHLIAAAPEMYAALKVIVLDANLLSWLEGHDPMALRQIRAALKRAGEEQNHEIADPICFEHGGPFDDNPGKGICKTCEDWQSPGLPEGQ